MGWIKKGLLFSVNGQRPWMLSHAANPVAEHRGGDLFRIYFGSRDHENRTHIGYVDVEMGVSHQIVGLAAEPVIGPGPIGGFDDSGTSMGCLVSVEGRRFLYFLGWNLGVTVPWRNSIGLAISDGPDAPFVRVSIAPILDRSDEDPYSLSYPWVLRDEKVWRMWYGSNRKWGKNVESADHVIKYAESSDGIHWRRDGIVAIDLAAADEFAVSRPCVLKENGSYHMWYGRRGQTYRIGYAQSPDGVHWERRDTVGGMDASGSGWDSEMVQYPCVFLHRGKRHLLYGGNGYGREGFGLAIAE